MKAQKTRWTGRVGYSEGVKALGLSRETVQALVKDVFEQLRANKRNGGKVFYGRQLLIGGNLLEAGSMIACTPTEIQEVVGCIYLVDNGLMRKGDFTLTLPTEWDSEKLPL